MSRRKSFNLIVPLDDLTLRANIRDQRMAELLAAARRLNRLMKSASDGDLAAFVRRLLIRR